MMGYDSYGFKWIVEGVRNPEYAGTTQFFKGEFRGSNGSALFTAFTPLDYRGITITPGILST